MTIFHVLNDLKTFHSHRKSLATTMQENFKVVIVAPLHPLTELIKTLGFGFRALDLDRKGINPFRELGCIWQLYKLYSREKPDLVHHFTIKPVIYGSLAARWAGVPRVVNTITGLGYVFSNDSIKARVLRFMVGWLYRLSLRQTQVIFQNEDDANLFLKAKWITPDQIHLVPGSGVDIAKFSATPEVPGPIKVVLPARMLWDKGIAEFIFAARKLRSQAEFLLAGDTDPGNPASIPQNQIDEWQQEGVVRWLGQVSDMPELLSSTHIVCLPSYREGLPMALLESAASGRPVVTTEVPGCRTAVIGGKTGFKVPARDGSALVNALQTLIADAELRRQFGARGRDMAEKMFSTTKVNHQILHIYNSLGI